MKKKKISSTVNQCYHNPHTMSVKTEFSNHRRYMHAHITYNNQMKSTFQWFQQKCTAVNTHTCEGTCGFGKLNTRVSPDGLCSSGRAMFSLVPCLSMYYGRIHFNDVIMTLSYTKHSRRPLELLYCFCFYIIRGDPIQLNKQGNHIHTDNLKAQKASLANSLNSFKQPEITFRKRHNGNTSKKKKKKNLTASQHP